MLCVSKTKTQSESRCQIFCFDYSENKKKKKLFIYIFHAKDATPSVIAFTLNNACMSNKCHNAWQQ